MLEFFRFTYPNNMTFTREVDEWRAYLGRFGISGRLQVRAGSRCMWPVLYRSTLLPVGSIVPCLAAVVLYACHVSLSSLLLLEISLLYIFYHSICIFLVELMVYGDAKIWEPHPLLVCLTDDQDRGAERGAEVAPGLRHDLHAAPQPAAARRGAPSSSLPSPLLPSQVWP